MSGIPVGLHPEAVEEAEAAVVWYAKRSTPAARRLEDWRKNLRQQFEDYSR